MDEPIASLVLDGSQPPAKGEVSGAFLVGIIRSFLDEQLVPKSPSLRSFEELAPDGWYPYSQLTELIDAVRAEIPLSKAILFRAGMHFIRIWYEQGPGKTMIHCGRDWLYANQKSGGYNSVVRGGLREEIGWCDITKADEENGCFVYENVMALSPEYVRGIFHGGCLLFNDMDYVDVEVKVREPSVSAHFKTFDLTVRYRLKPGNDTARLNHYSIEDIKGLSTSLDSKEVERLLWRHRSLLIQQQQSSEYFSEISQLLVATNRKSLDLAEKLQLKITELNSTKQHVQTLEGLLHICAWCKRMQDDDNSWVQLERYVCARTPASFTHSICPDCAERFGKA